MKKVIILIICVLMIWGVAYSSKTSKEDELAPQEVIDYANDAINDLTYLVDINYQALLKGHESSDCKVSGGYLIHSLDFDAILNQDYSNLSGYEKSTNKQTYLFYLSLNEDDGVICFKVNSENGKTSLGEVGGYAVMFPKLRDKFIEILGNDDIQIYEVGDDRFVMVGHKNGNEFIMPFDESYNGFADFLKITNIGQVPTFKTFYLQLYSNLEMINKYIECLEEEYGEAGTLFGDITFDLHPNY